MMALLLALSRASGEPYSLCEVLQDLSELANREVRIRGVWGVGDTGATLWADGRCPQPTIRDGWVWRDALELAPRMGDGYFNYRRLRKANPNANVVATLSGRLETRDRFDVRTFLDGSQIPIAFHYYVARLVYKRAENLEVVRPGPEQRQYWDEVGRKPFAVRAK
jgi:hypothetical protein